VNYINGFIAAVPTANREAFREHASQAAEVFREYGATSVVECWGDDVPQGEVTSFPMAVQAKDDETVIFSWMTWPSSEAHREGMDRAFADPRLSQESNPMPFDGKRLIYGGFTPALELGAPTTGGYVDGFVLAVPDAGRDTFVKFAEKFDPIFQEYGASWIVEAWGTDVPVGVVTDFRKAVKALPEETVVFSWIVWPNKEARNEGSRKVMSDPRFEGLEMPFDGRRMIYGGFTPIVEL